MQLGVRTRASHTPRTLSAGARRRLDPCIPESRMHRDPPFLPFPAMQTAPLEDGRLSSPKRAVRLFHAWEISRP